MFRMLKLRPPNGWNAVGWELAIVTLGVLIALGAQELVEDWNWKQKVADAEKRLREESKANFRFAAEQATVEPCLDAQLAVLEERLLRSQSQIEPAPRYVDGSFTFVFRHPTGCLRAAGVDHRAQRGNGCSKPKAAVLVVSARVGPLVKVAAA